MTEKTTPGRITLGRHSMVSASVSDREKIRRFYADALGCTITKRSDRIDYLRLGDDFYFAVLYVEEALSAAQFRRTIWLELLVHDVEVARKRILDFGGTQVEAPDPAHFFFQAPGGLVFRLVRPDEDFSRFER